MSVSDADRSEFLAAWEAWRTAGQAREDALTAALPEGWKPESLADAPPAMDTSPESLQRQVDTANAEKVARREVDRVGRRIGLRPPFRPPWLNGNPPV